jgi:medium-chain acyl-[acyl-carrier-protein] hydrolase
VTQGDTQALLWARRYGPPARPQPARRLVCLPHAGGSASEFRDWRLPERLGAEVWAVQLPGRENRLTERPFRRASRLAATLADELAPLMTGPFALFGHSMGALLAFELARSLRRADRALPSHMFLSGHRAPHLPPKHEAASQLPDEEFVARLEQMADGAHSPMRDPELMRMLAPMVRADLELCEEYRYRDEPPLAVPFTCFAANADSEVDPEDVFAWEAHTSRPTRTRLYAGGHLFVRDHAAEILSDMAADLLATWPGPTGGTRRHERRPHA